MQVKGRGPLGPGLLSLRSGLVQGLQTWNGRPWSKIHLKLRAESFPGPLCVCACTCVPYACVVCVCVRVSGERHHSFWKVFKKIHDLKKRNHFSLPTWTGRFGGSR